MLEFIKHLITCNCILRQYEEMEPPVFHKFVAFSVINSDGSIKPSYAKCNNCGAVHKVTEVNTSERIKKEDSPLVPDIEEIKASLPEKLVSLLTKYDLDVATWQQIKFVYENEKWDRPIVLHRETQGEDVQGKYLLLAGKTLWRIESFSTEDV